MIRVFFICQEEPFFIPKQVHLLLERANASYQVIGATVLASERKGRSRMDWYRERIRIHEPRELVMAGLAYAYCRILGSLRKLFGGSDPYSVRGRFKEYGIPILPVKDIHDKAYLKRLKELQPDVIVSISAPQRFRPPLLEVPRLYCLNLHASLLPAHRGVFGTWWPLYEEDEEAGGSIHRMEEKLDAGSLLWQQAFPINRKDSQYRIACRAKSLMAQGLVELLERIDRGTEREIEAKQPPSFHRAPTREEGRAFHRKGKRILRFSDLGRILRPTFETPGRSGEEAP